MFAYAVLIAGVALMIAAVSYTTSQPYPNPPNNERAAAPTTQRQAEPSLPSAPISRAANNSEPSPEHKQSKAERFAEKLLTDPIVYLTLAIAFLAYWQIAVYSEMRDHTVEIERAYVAISHEKIFITGSPDGQGGQDMKKPLGITATFSVRNKGRTPGNVMGGSMGFMVDSKPTTAMIRRVQFTESFLLPDGHYEFTWVIKADEDHRLPAILRGEGPERLWLIGAIHYTDRFGGLHEGGYGRCFVLDRRYGPCFNFVTETGPFNYDLPLAPDEAEQYAESQKRHEAHS